MEQLRILPEELGQEKSGRLCLDCCLRNLVQDKAAEDETKVIFPHNVIYIRGCAQKSQ